MISATCAVSWPVTDSWRESEIGSGPLRRSWRTLPVACVLTGIGVSALGDFAAIAALTIHVHDTTRSSWAVTGLVLAGLLPLVVLGPLAGTIVDLGNPAWLLRITTAIQAGLAAAVAFTSAYPAVLLLVFALGTGTAITQAGLLALLPSLLESKELLGRVNGRVEASRSAGITLGPPLGSLVTSVWGARGALLMDAVTFLVLCGALYVVPAAQSSSVRMTAATRTADRDILHGIRYIAHEPYLRLAVGMVSSATLFLASINVIEVFFAKDTLRAGDLGYGSMIGCWGLGMILGATLTGRRPSQRAWVTAVVTGCLIAGAAVAVSAIFPVLPVVITAWTIGGIANGSLNVAVRSLIHHRTPPALHGRVFAGQYSIYTAAKIASILMAGPVVGLVAPGGSLLVIGSSTVAIGLAGLFWRRSLTASAAEATRRPEEARA